MRIFGIWNRENFGGGLKGENVVVFNVNVFLLGILVFIWSFFVNEYFM